jgi:transposase-like protein
MDAVSAESHLPAENRPICSLCGRQAEPDRDGDPPLTWCADLIETAEGARTRWVCTECTRRFVRSIEAKLDQQWW